MNKYRFKDLHITSLMLEMIALATTSIHIAVLDQDFLIFDTLAPRKENPVAPKAKRGVGLLPLSAEKRLKFRLQ